MSASVARADDGSLPATPPSHKHDRTPIIWDTAKKLSWHPVLYDAICKVYRKIKDGGLVLATSYDTVVDGTTAAPDHIEVLLSLPGEFGLFDPRKVEEEKKRVIAITNSTGIYFNRWLVHASTICLWEVDPDDLEAALATDINVLSYSALLQESLQHELATHLLKNHHEEKMNDDSGFTDERRIREQHGKDSQQPCLLTADSACIERKWKAPVNLGHWSRGSDLIAPQKNLRTFQPLTIEEIKAHMDYGGAPPAARAVATGDETITLGERPAKKAKIQQPAGLKVMSLEEKDDEEDVIRGSDEKDGYKLFASLWNSGKWGEVEETAKNTKVDVTFCDKVGQPKTSFTALEDVFVRLTFENPTDNDAYVRTAGGRFGRDGIVMEVKGEPPRYLPTDSFWGFVVAKISPGASHTFLRKLCGGPGGRMARGLNVNNVPYWTPEKPETYYARVVGWDEKFPFKIVDEIAK